jgi:hypothetical protein
MPGQQDLAETFTCMAQVGVHGSGITGEAMVAALQPAINDPLTTSTPATAASSVTTRSWSSPSSRTITTRTRLGTVDEWIEALRAAKNYDDDAFMVLVLTTDVDVDYHQLCWPNLYFQTKNRLRLPRRGRRARVHRLDLPGQGYSDFFKEHVSHLVDLCDDFAPP